MKTITSLVEMQTAAGERRTRCAFVPTMGALHRGHLELIRIARECVGKDGGVVVSIFVNPTQFEPGADFEKYPRPEKEDTEQCRDAGVDILFRPAAAEMYAPDQSVTVEETKLSSTLCGASRPGHFRGVCTVVTKLFHLVQPDFAVFGEKDFQQLAIIRRMVRDLNFPIEIVGVPTVRESDGLALSSRNQYLNDRERLAATVLRRAALAVQAKVGAGERSSESLLVSAREMIATTEAARIDYLRIVDAKTLEPVGEVGKNAVFALAVFIGQTRLIDNLRLP